MSTVDRDLDNNSANTREVTRITVTDASVYPVGSRIKIMSKDLLSGPDHCDSERQGEYATVADRIWSTITSSQRHRWRRNTQHTRRIHAWP